MHQPKHHIQGPSLESMKKPQTGCKNLNSHCLIGQGRVANHSKLQMHWSHTKLQQGLLSGCWHHSINTWQATIIGMVSIEIEPGHLLKTATGQKPRVSGPLAFSAQQEVTSKSDMHGWCSASWAGPCRPSEMHTNPSPEKSAVVDEKCNADARLEAFARWALLASLTLYHLVGAWVCLWSGYPHFPRPTLFLFIICWGAAVPMLTAKCNYDNRSFMVAFLGISMQNGNKT